MSLALMAMTKNGQKIVVTCHNGFIVQIHDGKQIWPNPKNA